jgi:hypothetical protein
MRQGGSSDIICSDERVSSSREITRFNVKKAESSKRKYNYRMMKENEFSCTQERIG